jgi:hypothetical protein
MPLLRLKAYRTGMPIGGHEHLWIKTVYVYTGKLSDGLPQLATITNRKIQVIIGQVRHNLTQFNPWCATTS